MWIGDFAVGKLVVAGRCESGPGSCQEARWQAGGVGGKRPVSKLSARSIYGNMTLHQSAPAECCGKRCEKRVPYMIAVSSAVYDVLSQATKLTDGTNMWTRLESRTIWRQGYQSLRSNYGWGPG